MTLFEFGILLCTCLAWGAIALMALLALRFRKQSTPLKLQTMGATAMAALGLVQWVLQHLIGWIIGYGNITFALGLIFQILTLVAICTFALGYCLGYFSSNKPVEVKATPA
jgi:hypothetical protein